MVRQTSRLGLPYPERPDTADVPRDVEALAEASDILVPYYSGPISSRPAPGVPGRFWKATDLPPDDPNSLTMDTGTIWQQVSFTLTIADRSLNHVKLMLDTITVDEMGPNSVGTSELIDSSVNAAKIFPASVGSIHIASDLKPSQGAPDANETLRSIMPPAGGPSAGRVAKAIHGVQHQPNGVDPSGMNQWNWPLYMSAYISPAPITGTVNDWNPAGLAGANTIRISSTANAIITGLLSDGSSGRMMALHNIGTFEIRLPSDASSSVAANRFLLGTSVVTMKPNDTVWLQYDTVSQRWRGFAYTAVPQRIMSGSINSNGSPSRGSGFNSVNVGAGRYTITFDFAWDVIPLIFAIAQDHDYKCDSEPPRTTTQLGVGVSNSNDVRINSSFDFIVVAPT